MNEWNNIWKRLCDEHTLRHPPCCKCGAHIQIALSWIRSRSREKTLGMHQCGPETTLRRAGISRGGADDRRVFYFKTALHWRYMILISMPWYIYMPRWRRRRRQRKKSATGVGEKGGENIRCYSGSVGGEGHRTSFSFQRGGDIFHCEALYDFIEPH